MYHCQLYYWLLWSKLSLNTKLLWHSNIVINKNWCDKQWYFDVNTHDCGIFKIIPLTLDIHINPSFFRSWDAQKSKQMETENIRFSTPSNYGPYDAMYNLLKKNLSITNGPRDCRHLFSLLHIGWNIFPIENNLRQHFIVCSIWQANKRTATELVQIFLKTNKLELMHHKMLMNVWIFFLVCKIDCTISLEWKEFEYKFKRKYIAC